MKGSGNTNRSGGERSWEPPSREVFSKNRFPYKPPPGRKRGRDSENWIRWRTVGSRQAVNSSFLWGIPTFPANGRNMRRWLVKHKKTFKKALTPWKHACRFV